jgi:uncharacterized protein YbjQ (UPF0145 family)
LRGCAAGLNNACAVRHVGATQPCRLRRRRAARGAGSQLQRTTRNEECAMLVVTTPHVPGREITEVFGMVSGEAILGANVFKDLFAGVRDIVGGRAAAYERELRKAKEIAIQEMENECAALGGNAIIGVDLDYESLNMSRGGNMLMVSASGTAVRLR